MSCHTRMDSVDHDAPPPEPTPAFHWDLVPVAIQETILSFLPVSSLIICTSVSRSLRSTIRSPVFTSSYRRLPRRRDHDLLFLFILPESTNQNRVAAYLPSCDSWLHLLIPDGLRGPVASGGSLLVEEVDKGLVLITNPLRPAQTTAVLPLMEPITHSYPLALIESSPPQHFLIVSVTTDDHQVRSQVYDSRSSKWHLRGHLPLRVARLRTAAYLDGLLYCLSHGPDHLLTFDPVGGEWTLLDAAMPAPTLVCSHIMVFDGGLFLVAGVEDAGAIVEVVIWEFDVEKKPWRVICSMPEEFFGRFVDRRHKYFDTVDRAGKVCFYNWKVNLLLMFDLGERQWWWPRPCDISNGRKLWFGQALEPQIDLVL